MKEQAGSGSNTTQYIQSDNLGNTIDNKQRTVKPEDPRSANYPDPPVNKEDPQSGSGEARSASTETEGAAGL